MPYYARTPGLYKKSGTATVSVPDSGRIKRNL
jgi:hypothetical protein